MYIDKGYKYLISLFSVILVFTFLGGEKSFANYYDDKIVETREKIKTIEERVNNLETSVYNLEHSKIDLDSEVEKFTLEIDRLSKMITVTETRLKEKKQVLSGVEKDLIKTYNEISALEVELSKREESFRGRVQSLHKGGNITIVDVVMTSNSVGDLLRRVSSYKSIVSEDNRIIEEYLDLSEKLKSKKERSEKLVVELESHLEELYKIENDLNSDKVRNSNLKKDKELKSTSVSNQIKSMLEEREVILDKKSGYETSIKSLEKEKVLYEEELKRSAAEYHSNSYKDLSGISEFSSSIKEEIESGRKFITPAQGRFTSPMGPRWGRIHQGIDIANKTGSPILASSSGVVTEARSMGGYGNVVMLRHNIDGKVYSTVYAHLSSFGVVSGERVEQGQVIGLMGNTGNSTGPHLHFELHEGAWNSQYTYAVNPLKYLR